MSEDLISTNFADNVNKSIIERIIPLVGASFILLGIYEVCNIIDWYLVLAKAEFLNVTPRIIFLYRIHPVISLILSVISIVCYSLNFKANKLINLSFEKQDADFFNKGYSLFYRSVSYSIISWIIAIISIAIRISFKL